MKGNKTWLAWALSVGLIAYLLGAAVVGRTVVSEGEVIRGYATGTAFHLDALQEGGAPDGTRLADVEVAFSAANVDSEGFGAVSGANENEVFLQPNPADHDPATPFVGKNASGRGGPIEIGLINGVPVEPTIPLTLFARSGAVAPPDTQESNEAGLEDALSPLAYASLLHSDALAQWETSTCLRTAQSPISYGRGYAADVQLLDTEQNPDGGPFESPIVHTNDDDPSRRVVETSSFIYATGPNAQGKFGLVSEIHQTYAPIQLGGTLIIEILGEWFVKTTVDGINPATMEYGVTDPATGEPMDPGATVIRISTDGGLTYSGFSLQDLQPEGIVIDAAPLPIQIALGEDLRAISAPGAIPDPDSSPTLTATEASGAVDVVRIDALDDPASFGSLADLRIGHFESELQVPAGGFTCPPPPTTSTTTTSTTVPSTTTSSTSTSTSTTTTSTTTTSTSTTTTTAPPSTTSTAPTTTSTTAPPPPSPPAVPIRVQPRTVG